MYWDQVTAIVGNIFYGLFKASLLFVFIYAIVETWKSVSCAGLLKVFSQAGMSLISNNKLIFGRGQLRVVDTETWHTLVFVISLTACKLFNFTLMATFLGLDLSDTTKFSVGATWFDYVATSCVIYKGADWFYQTFGEVLQKGFKFKEFIEKLMSKAGTVSSQPTNQP